MRSTHRRSAAAALALMLVAPIAAAQPVPRAPDVVFIPTPQQAVEQMLALAGVGPRDVVYDLGSGDGRIVVTAAERYGARGVGVDIDPDRVREGRDLAARRDVADRVRFVAGDLFEVAIADASVVTLFLLPSLNERLRPRLLGELRPGARVVSYRFGMGDWEPDRVVSAAEADIFLWVVPAAVEGRWMIERPDGRRHVLDLHQRFQQVFGTMGVDGVRETIRDGRLDGPMLRLTTDGGRFEARVDDDRLVAAGARGESAVVGWRVGEALIAP